MKKHIVALVYQTEPLPKGERRTESVQTVELPRKPMSCNEFDYLMNNMRDELGMYLREQGWIIE